MSVVNRNLLFAVFSIAFSPAFQHGYQTGLTNMPRDEMINWVYLILKKRDETVKKTDVRVMMIYKVAILIFDIGAMIGGYFTKFFCEKFGRKGALYWNSIIGLFGITVITLCERTSSYEVYIIGRILIGIHTGLNSGICQIYLIEIAPTLIRGAVAGFYQVIVKFSNCVALVTTVFLSDKYYWNLMLAVAAVPILVQILCLPFCPESVRFIFISKEDEDQAEEGLRWLRKQSDVTLEMNELREEHNVIKEMPSVNLRRMWQDRFLRTNMVVCCVISFGQHFAGVYLFSSYGNRISDSYDAPKEISSIVLPLATFFGFLVTLCGILYIDHTGRRKFLLCGYACHSINNIFLVIATKVWDIKGRHFDIFLYIAIGFTMLHYIFSAPGIGTIPCFITAELFGYSARCYAVSVVCVANWAASLTYAVIVIPMESFITSYILLLATLVEWMLYFFVKYFLPETSRLTFREILDYYN